ncbi:MAG: PAS domain S-box protein [Gemmatimonadaceae bacterium]|nr:PAS domain S-box protein [Gemmatimonadaceae bacterium]
MTVETAQFPSQEHVLQQIVDTASTVILGLRTDLTVFEWNPAAEALYGIARADAIGMAYLDRCIAAEQRDAVRADIAKVLAGTPTRGFIDDSILPDGSRRSLIWNVDRVVARDGTPFGIVAIGADITEQLREREIFRAIFESSSDGLLIADSDGVIDCNPAALRILGLTERAALVGRRAASFSPPRQPDGEDSMAKARRLGRETMERGAAHFEWVHRRADGRDVPVDVSVRRVRVDGRDISVSTWHDLSAARALEAERAALEQRLFSAQKLEAVGHLAGGIAHDFNNLLTAIRGAIELARLDLRDSHPAATELDLALGVADRAAALTRQLLVVGRRAGPMQARPVDFVEVVREAIAIATRSFPETIGVDLALPDGAAVVHGDMGQLEQVVLNLVLNARDAMPGGGLVTVEVEAHPTTVVLRIVDAGVGMDAATQARIFEPFFSTKPVSHGTGLGLSVVYGIVSQAGGSIAVQSAPGQGATFTVTLPRVEAAPVAVDRVAVMAPIAAHEAVLLVEDEAQVRATTRRMLERAGYRVLEARHGRDALDLLRRHPGAIDVVLTDVRMPEMDGGALFTALAQVAPRLPVVFMSAYDRVGLDATSALPPGAPFVEKPFTRDALLGTLREALRTVG